jgi:Fe-S oxidoreductase
MAWIEVFFIILFQIFGVTGFLYIVWNRRLRHVWPKLAEVEIVYPAGLFTGAFEVLSQRRVVANRPWVGLFHLPLFYGFVAYAGKSVIHVLAGMGVNVHTPQWYQVSLYGVAVAVLAAVVYMAVRRFAFARDRLTHMLESSLVLALIAILMITHLFEMVVDEHSVWGKLNWWVHFLTLMGFPALIAYGKHLHLLIGPVNVVLRHMTELPSDRPVFGSDFDMSDEEKFEAEYARVGMPNGVADFSFHSLFDPAACIECGRCNDACPSGPELQPRDHFVLSMRDVSLDAAGLSEIVPPDVLATCTQCRACDTVCPVGNRPSKAGLEIRGRMTFEGLYPPRKLKDGGKSVPGTGNIFGEQPATRASFIEENGFPIYDPSQHEVLFVLGCQGGNHPEAQPVVVATGKLLDAAGVSWGVLAEESCWGEGLLHSGALMEDWPMWWSERVEALDAALGGDRDRAILTICPHCKDTIGTQYAQLGAVYSKVMLHVDFLGELIGSGKLGIEPRAAQMAVHHPCKLIHNDEVGEMDALLQRAGVATVSAGNSPAVPRCCGGGGGGFLWDSPAPVNKLRWDELSATGHKTIVTGCPGCHRMIGAVRDQETTITDVATVLAERLPVISD